MVIIMSMIILITRLSFACLLVFMLRHAFVSSGLRVQLLQERVRSAHTARGYLRCVHKKRMARATVRAQEARAYQVHKKQSGRMTERRT